MELTLKGEFLVEAKNICAAIVNHCSAILHMLNILNINRIVNIVSTEDTASNISQ